MAVQIYPDIVQIFMQQGIFLPNAVLFKFQMV